ncbi:hypothetical protein BDV12DRAFT_61415 [Aspergillus spectabilis]
MGLEKCHLASLFFLTLHFGHVAIADSKPTSASMPKFKHPGHVHAPNSDETTKYADWVVILVLGVVVFTIFALGLMHQFRDTLILFTRGKQHLEDKEKGYEIGEVDDYPTYAQHHNMSDLEGGTTSNNLAADSSNEGDSVNLSDYPRWITRNGNINQHAVDVNGSRKLVLFVDVDLPRDEVRDEVQDGYTEWLRRWREEREGHNKATD